MSSRLFAFVLILALLGQAIAHVSFTVSTASNGKSLMTRLKVPHGCVTHGDDSGADPVDSIELATTSVAITIPAEISSAMPALFPNWALTQSSVTSASGSNSTIFTYTAAAGFELQPWQLLLLDFSFSMPTPAVTTKYIMPVVQTCTSGVVVEWATNGITVLSKEESDNTKISKSITIQKDADSNVRSMAIAAIVLSSIALFVMLLVIAHTFGRSSPSSKFKHQPSASNLQMSNV